MEKPKDVLQNEDLSVKSVDLSVVKLDPKGVRSVELFGKSVDLCVVKLDPKGVRSVELVGVDELPLGESHDGLSGLCQSEVARNGDRCVKDVALEEKSVALAGKSVDLSVVKLDPKGVRSVELVGKSVDLSVVKLDPKGVRSVELVGVDELPLGESHDGLGGRDVLEVHAEGVGEVN